MKKFLKIFNFINFPCFDDDKKFLKSKKIDNINIFFRDFVCREGNLYKFYYKYKFKLVISSHIDSVYKKTFCKKSKKGFKGTLDNTLTNAIIIYCLKKYPKIFTDVGIVFTGNEERESKGAKEFAQLINTDTFILNLDVTSSINNKPRFENVNINTNLKFLNYLKTNKKFFDVDFSYSDDDNREYSKKTKNSFSVCIPIFPLSYAFDWMHQECGQFVYYSAIKKYIKTLIKTIKVIKKMNK